MVLPVILVGVKVNSEQNYLQKITFVIYYPFNLVPLFILCHISEISLL